MIADLVFLWKNREQPPQIKRWLVVWVKRSLQFFPLLLLLNKPFLLRLKGAHIGKLVVLGKAVFQGRLVNLYVNDQVSLGRCNIALHDRITIGKCAVINDGVILLTASHGISDPQWKQKTKPIVIGEYAWIATNAIILPGVSIGRGAVVGAGAVVREDVPEFAVVVGNPASVTKVERTKQLNYSPPLFNAPFEAWVGRNIHNIIKEKNE